MIEKDIEKKIIDKILSVVDIPGLYVHGSWQPETVGAIKDQELADAVIVCAVSVSPCAFRSYTDPRAEMECSIATVFRTDSCPTGAEIVEFSQAILKVLRDWNFDRDGELENDLTTPEFSPGGLLMNGGTAPAYDSTSGVWSVTQNFTLSGVVLD